MTWLCVCFWLGFLVFDLGCVCCGFLVGLVILILAFGFCVVWGFGLIWFGMAFPNLFCVV